MANKKRHSDDRAEAKTGRARGTVRPAPVSSLQAREDGPSIEETGLDTVLEIPVTLSMELGRASISIRKLLTLSQGSVVELDRAAGEPLDVLVNGTRVARGEVVIVNEKYAIRLTEVISAPERIVKLK